MCCKNFIPEKDNPYPLCDNKDCELSATCNLSAHMDESPYRPEEYMLLVWLYSGIEDVIDML